MKNLFDIKDKVIVITGGCGILGKNIANYLAEQGAKIVILDRVEEAGRELEAELNNLNPNKQFMEHFLSQFNKTIVGN